jgi:hypothetical protein
MFCGSTGRQGNNKQHRKKADWSFSGHDNSNLTFDKVYKFKETMYRGN